MTDFQGLYEVRKAAEDREEKLYARCVVLILVGMCIGLLGGWVFKSHFEAKIFNELTGRNVTTWQAMFVELRVDDD